MADLTVDIVTPERTVFSGAALEVRAPGASGEFGVLPDHTQFLALLKAGVVTVKTSGGEQRFAVGRGFAEAGPDRVVLLTDSCEAAASVDKDAAAKLLEVSLAAVTDSEPGTEKRLEAEQNAELAQARLDV